ncbi:MAG: GNAT family N-acetyltransferase [Candidatus Adiutrix sp.]|jgi:GNAT superfamily N-acetyltransferase|nr:GNAT family N-acetyltransferase [Candidatus Adiutrix sp.]
MSGRARKASALASALTRLARNLASAGRPFDLWTPPLTARDILAASERVARGEAEVLWADEAAPDRGLMLYAPSPRETSFFGYGCARLAGPYLPPADQGRREAGAARLAALALARARERRDRLATLKTGLDPAALRGLLAGGFALAETITVLALDLGLDPARPAGPPPGFVWREGGQEPAETLAEALGDFFYDGHLRHDQEPGPEAARRLWRQAVLDDLAGAADETVVLWDKAGGRGAGLATAHLPAAGLAGGEEAGLSILALAEPYRGRGLGRHLLAELIRRLKGRAGRLRAETAAYNLPALALYQALGFKPGPPLAALHLRYKPADH